MCSTVELVDCTFSGVLQTAVFKGAVPPQDQKAVGRVRNEFRGNDFSACRLIDVGFRGGIDLDAQRLPTDPKYLYLRRADKAVSGAVKRVGEWTDSAKRSHVSGLMQALGMEVASGQKQLLLNPDTFTSVDRGVLDEVFAVLRDEDNKTAT
jgi:hypothetical protein